MTIVRYVDWQPRGRISSFLRNIMWRIRFGWQRPPDNFYRVERNLQQIYSNLPPQPCLFTTDAATYRLRSNRKPIIPKITKAEADTGVYNGSA